MATPTYVGDGNSGDGVVVQGNSTGKLAFYGATPVVQPTAAAQAAITDGSTGTAAPTNGVAALTATYNSTILANALATIIAQGNAFRTALVNLGAIKGS
jgi:hypothetical protein